MLGLGSCVNAVHWLIQQPIPEPVDADAGYLLSLASVEHRSEDFIIFKIEDPQTK